MKIPYQFKLMRFVPDTLAGEFVNIGLVLFCPSQGWFRAKFTNRLSRVSGLFPGQNLDALRKMLSNLQSQINGLARQWEENPPDFQNTPTLDEILHTIYPPSINLLQWAPSQGFLGNESAEVELATMYQRTIGKYEEEHHTNNSLEAERAARQPYWVHFERLGITKKLSKHQVDVAHTKVKFEHAWKNGIWHAYEELPMTIIKKESAQERINSWVGKIKLLSHAQESMKIHFLTPEGAGSDLVELAKMQLATQMNGLEAIVVTPNEASSFAERVRGEMGE
jgi:hypothetical protein